MPDRPGDRRSGAAARPRFCAFVGQIPDAGGQNVVRDGRPALLVLEQPGGRPVYCLFVRFRHDQICFIRDYRYARYVFDEAQWAPSRPSPTAHT